MNDLRHVLAAPTIRVNDDFAVAFKTPFGELRYLYWLTEGEAAERATALRLRGYTVVSGPMDL